MINKKLSFLGKIGLAAVCFLTAVMPVSTSAAVNNNYLWENLNNYDHSKWYASDGWSNGSMFDCTWRDTNVSFENGIMTLRLDEDKKATSTSPKYAGAEYRTNDFYGYGMYSTRMKPAKNTGIVSSFFTYTGPTDGTPWDEIDIEFLGKNTNCVQFNYYTNGRGNHEYVHWLGFDASQSYHTYAFNWQPNYIAWYVDGKEVHRAWNDIPSHPGKIMLNMWPGINVDSWLNHFYGPNGQKASYDWMSYDPQ